MATRDESWTRLAAEGWFANPGIARFLAASGASAQRLSGGSFSTICDEYKIVVDRMPTSETPEAIIDAFADSPNDAVNNGWFNVINVFARRTRGNKPAVGDIYDIDLVGPDNGAVMTIEQSSNFGAPMTRPESWFAVQAIETPEHGTLPEYGAREFGLEYAGGKACFYTRGVSRAGGGGAIVAAVSKIPQQRTWIAAMTGLRDRITRAGGTVSGEVERNYKVIHA